MILSKYKFTVDLFASDENCKVKRFYSRFECHNTRGVDCFNFSWKNEVVYACPPPVFAMKTVLFMKECKCKGVLVFPEWKSSTVWPVLKQDSIKIFIKNFWTFPGKNFLKSNVRHKLFNENFVNNLCVVMLDFT